MLRSVLSGVILIVVVLLMSGDLSAEVPLVVSHQGRLLDASDAPVSGVFTIVYSIWDAETGGTQLWMEDHTGVVVTDGLFSVQLGTTVPITSDILHGSGGGGGGSGGTRYLQLQLPGLPPISPRTQLSSSPFSITSHSVGGDIETFPGGFKTRCQGCNDPWRGDISAASVPGADSIQVVRLNGLPPGTPVTGRIAVAVTGDVSSIALGDIDADGALDMHCGPDSTVIDFGASDGGSLVSSYRAKAGKSGATKRMAHTDINGESAIDEACDASGAGIKLLNTASSGNQGFSIHCAPDSIVLIEQVTDGRADVMLYKATTGKSGKAKQSLFMVPGGGTVVENEDCDNGGTERNLRVSNIGSSAQENGTLDRITADSITTENTILSGGTLLTSYSARQGSTGRTKRTAAYTLDGSRSQDDEVVSISSGARRRLETHNLGSSGQDGVSDLRCTPDSIIAENTITAGSELKTQTYTAKQGKTGSASGKRTINPGGGSSETEEVCDTAGASLRMKVDGLMGPRMSTNLSISKQSSSHLLAADLDGDGVLDNVCSSSSSDISASMGVSSRFGSGPRQTVSMDGSFSSANTRCGSDSDGDGLDDASVTQSADDVESRLAIKTKGTSAGGKVSKVDAFTIKQGVAGIEGSTDDDGDGVPERRFQTLSNASKARHGCAADIDGDGQLDRISSLETDSLTAAMRVGADDDDDGVVDWSASVTADTADAQVLTTGSDIEVAMKVKNKGVIKGNVTINNASARMVDFDSDGDGFLENSLGVGVDATHKIDVVGGAYCDGTNWVNASDRNAKENFEKVNGVDILERIAELEITKWNYKGDVDAQHIGPTAQDFKKAFGVGADDKSISTIDPSGIALAAIKELYTQLQAKDKEMSELREELAKLRKEIAKKK